VLFRLVSLLGEGEFWTSTFSSLIRIVAGFLLATAAGCAVAVLAAVSPFLYDLMSPVIRIIRATPVTSFIILALIWLRTDSVPVFAAFLMVFPIVWENVYKGIQNTSPQLKEMAGIFRLSRGVVFKRIYVPSVMPYFIAACNISIGMAWKAGIAAEVIGRPKNAIGTSINDAKLYLETINLFAWTAVVIIVSILAEAVFVRIFKRFINKYSHGGRKV
jgi:NitT/TauT family transport system permease protein